jgi:hypothetical protein
MMIKPTSYDLEGKTAASPGFGKYKHIPFIARGSCMRADSSRTGAEQKKPAESAATNAAKWLVPSVTALFVAIGYVIRSAHIALLGADFSYVTPEHYTGDAGDFLYSVIGSLFDFIAALGAPKQPVFAGLHREVWALSALILVCALLTAFARSRRRRWGITIALAVCVAAKLCLFDAPLALIENKAISFAPAPPGTSAQDVTGSTKFRASVLIQGRSDQLWKEMRCKRLDRDNQALGGEAGISERHAKLLQSCTPGDPVRDEFILQIISTSVIIALAIIGIRTGDAALNIASVLALLYCLTLPYAYGKLLKPTTFQYGKIQFDDKLGPDATTSLGKEAYAIVLGNGPGGLSFLVMTTNKCPGGEQQAARIWTVNSGNIMAVKEIYRKDVITWKMLNESDCIAPPPLTQAHQDSMSADSKAAPGAAWSVLRG